MIDLSTLNKTHLVNPGWHKLLDHFPEIAAAKQDPRFFKQVDGFKNHLREIVSIAAELNSNNAAVEQAFSHVKASKFLSKQKPINQFEDIQKQTYKICIEALETDLKAMSEALRSRNSESLERQYNHIARWPIRFENS